MPRRLPLALLALLLPLLLAAGGQAASPEEIVRRGLLRCGLAELSAGLARRGEADWHGFDVDYCRAFAVALLGSPEAIAFYPPEPSLSLASGEIDLLARAEAEGPSQREVATTLLRGLGWLYREGEGPRTVSAMAGRRGCGTGAEAALADRRRLLLERYPSLEAAGEAFLSGRCELLLGEMLALAAWRREAVGQGGLAFGQGQISLTSSGPVVDSKDQALAERLGLVVALLFEAEAAGLTQSMARGEAAVPPDARARQLLEGVFAEGALPGGWARRVLAAVGNYGEIFARNLGAGSPLDLPRGVNRLPEEGGLLRSLPLR